MKTVRLMHLVPLFSAAALVLSGCASTGPDAGWTTLVDGVKGIDQFNRVSSANWAVTDGALQASAGVKDPAYLVTRESYGDFTIRAEFWASDDANSGIFFRCTKPAVIDSNTCFEANIFDQRPDPTYGTAAIVDVAKVVPMPKAGGKWNTMEVTAKGQRLTLTFNGVQTVDATVPATDARLAAGPVALQWGRGVIKFRKVQIKPA
jgi:hypothetical protein